MTPEAITQIITAVATAIVTILGMLFTQRITRKTEDRKISKDVDSQAVSIYQKGQASADKNAVWLIAQLQKTIEADRAQCRETTDRLEEEIADLREKYRVLKQRIDGSDILTKQKRPSSKRPSDHHIERPAEE